MTREKQFSRTTYQFKNPDDSLNCKIAKVFPPFRILQVIHGKVAEAEPDAEFTLSHNFL